MLRKTNKEMQKVIKCKLFILLALVMTKSIVNNAFEEYRNRHKFLQTQCFKILGIDFASELL